MTLRGGNAHVWLVLKYFLVLKMETISEVAKRELGNYKFQKKKC